MQGLGAEGSVQGHADVESRLQDASPCGWYIHVTHVDLTQLDERPAIRSASSDRRLATHYRAFGSGELVENAWTVALAAQRLDEIPAWRLTGFRARTCRPDRLGIPALPGRNRTIAAV